ncbi:MAG: hypothetical protein ACP5NI_04970 [Acetobacteraceae bacterium]
MTQFTDIPKLDAWQKESRRAAPANPPVSAKIPGFAAIDKLIELYPKLMPMARLNTLLDLREAVKAWIKEGAKWEKLLTSPLDKQDVKKGLEACTDLERIVGVKLRSMASSTVRYETMVGLGYAIKTGTTKSWLDSSGRNVGTASGYLGAGTGSVENDMTARVNQMIAAIQAAYTLYQANRAAALFPGGGTAVRPPQMVDERDRKALKLFMGPEFFFRGALGAFTSDHLHGKEARPSFGEAAEASLLDRLRAETKKSQYADWLFVLGTFVCGSENTGVACFSGHPGAWMAPAAVPSTVKRAGTDTKPLLKCPSCNRFLLCSCGHPLRVFRNQRAVCTKPGCTVVQTGVFEEKVKTVVIDNYVLVQKGGYGSGDGLHDYTLQKELISSIDFQITGGPTKPDQKRIFGADQLVEGPPSGSPGERRGGGVFTMDGIAFGMEICLDHLAQRLAKDPERGRLQIQLIPSAGMDIKTAGVACIANGVLFNVDGVRGDADVRLNDGLLSAKGSVATGPVADCATACFPEPANQRVVLFPAVPIPP